MDKFLLIKEEWERHECSRYVYLGVFDSLADAWEYKYENDLKDNNYDLRAGISYEIVEIPYFPKPQPSESEA